MIFLKQVRDHKCGFETEQNYCSICVAHALDPNNTTKDDRIVIMFVKFWFGMIFLVVSSWAYLEVLSRG